MAIQTTRWGPDTCGCVIEYTWDDSVPDVNRVHTFSRVVNQCTTHSGVPMDVTLFNVILPENQGKNKVYNQILGIPGISTTNTDGSITLKSGITIKFSWSGANANRLLTVSVSGVTLTATQKLNLQNWCDTNLGVGKVLVQ